MDANGISRRHALGRTAAATGAALATTALLDGAAIATATDGDGGDPDAVVDMRQRSSGR